MVTDNLNIVAWQAQPCHATTNNYGMLGIIDLRTASASVGAVF